MKIALFLGAGASKFANMPTTKDLVDKVLTQVIHHKIWEIPTSTHLAKNIVKVHADKDIEELYTTVRVMIDAEKQHKTIVKYKAKTDNPTPLKREIKTTSPHHPDDVTTKGEIQDIDETVGALESLEAAIRDTLLAHLMVKQEYRDDIVRTYGELFKFVPSNIVTTNYDNVLETYCEQTGLDLANGFKMSHLGNRRIWDDLWANEASALHLIKLHGSITWQEDDNDDVLEIGRPGLRDTKQDVMITPTLGEKDYGNGIFPTLLDRFKIVLAETELLIVIGFSFRDPGINRMIQSRLKCADRNSRPMRLLYIDPNHYNGMKELLGPNVKPREVQVPGKCVLWDYSLDEMPYVYAYCKKFGPDAIGFIKHALDAVNEVCRKA